LKSMQKLYGTALILITHDLSVVARTADRMYIMYSGKIVEEASVRELFQSPYHPYTDELISLVPTISVDDEFFKSGHLKQIPLSVPNPMDKPKGCYFNPRCSRATDICRKQMPPLEYINDRQVRCHNWNNGGDAK